MRALDYEILHFPITSLAKKVVFLVSRGKKEISSLLAPPLKKRLATSGKIHYWPPPGKRPSDTHDD